jgi:hypothetical protein
LPAKESGMTPLITVILAIATTLSVFAIAIAKGDLLKNSPDWLVPILIAASAALYVLAGILALIHWKKERRSESVAITPPFSQVIKQEANPRIENTVVVHRDIPAPLKSSPAEQYDYDKLQAALTLLKDPALIALRYIRSVGTLTFGGMYSPTLPSGLTPDTALWVYRHCASEGLLNCTPNLGRTQETFSVPPKMDKIFDEVLFQEKGLSGLTDVRHN